MHWEKSVPSSFVSDSEDSGSLDSGQTRCSSETSSNRAPSM